jgi:Zn finger protein HypA/HybF involved in hydrogenase expression
MTGKAGVSAAKLFLPAAALIVWNFLSPSYAAEEKAQPPMPPRADANRAGEYPVPPPPFSKGIFPCTECHNKDLPVDKTRRKLEAAHDEIQLRHDEKHMWCLDCHNADNRDTLRNASGEPIKFEESYKLCGQCHGEKYRDWKAGVHGKRSGEWNGRKTYLLCVHCHDPHSPKYKSMAPMPPPARPENRR